MGNQSGLTDADVARILRLIDSIQDVEVRIEVEGMKLHVRKLSAASAPTPGGPIRSTSSLANDEGDGQPSITSPAAAPAAAQPPPQPKVATPTATPTKLAAKDRSASSNVIAIRAPMLGRFFRAASPTEPPYVEAAPLSPRTPSA